MKLLEHVQSKQKLSGSWHVVSNNLSNFTGDQLLKNLGERLFRIMLTTNSTEYVLAC